MKNDKITFPSNLTGDYKFSSIKLSIFIPHIGIKRTSTEV